MNVPWEVSQHSCPSCTLLQVCLLGHCWRWEAQTSSSIMWSNHMDSPDWGRWSGSDNRSKRINVSGDAAWVYWNLASRQHKRMGALSLWAPFSGVGLCIGPCVWNRAVAVLGSQGALLPRHQTIRINKTASLTQDEIKSSGLWPKHGQLLLWALELPITCTS